jgi:hypothetical protein
MKKFPIGKQDFKNIIENNYVYIDKTKYIYELAKNGVPIFISRPRRFGKSLTVSTLFYLFSGEKELFKNTYIYDKWEWEKYPIIRLSMAQIDITNEETIKETLKYQILSIYEENNIEPDTDNLKMLFWTLIKKLSSTKEVVILIDEYDRPILNHINDGKAESIRNILKEFYVIIKEADQYIKFAFMTGITKLTKTGIFSTLNNLRDITTNKNYSQMMGVTQNELEYYFQDFISETSKELNIDNEKLLEKIKENYNGFSFDGKNFVYNPFSILHFFQDKEFKNYWIETGTPQYLSEYIKKHKIQLEDITNKYIDESKLTTYEIENAPPIIYLIQSGYLTFKDKKEYLGFLVDYPNREVKESMSELLLEETFNISEENLKQNIIISLQNKNIEKVIEEIKTIFNKIPYNLFQEKESWYHSIILTILWACGLKAKAEVPGNLGKSDIELEFENDIYIIELKKDKPEKSIQQIKQKEYSEKYKKSITIIGIEIDTTKRNITNYIIEKLKK